MAKTRGTGLLMLGADVDPELEAELILGAYLQIVPAGTNPIEFAMAMPRSIQMGRMDIPALAPLW